MTTSSPAPEASTSYRPQSAPSPSKGADAGGRFPDKLFHMLEQNKYAHVISWSEDGKMVYIHDPAELEKIMGTIWRSSSYPTFQRQMNIYGFSRTSTVKRNRPGQANRMMPSTWSHPTICRGSTADDLAKLKRNAPKRVRGGRRPSTENDGDGEGDGEVDDEEGHVDVETVGDDEAATAAAASPTKRARRESVVSPTAPIFPPPTTPAMIAASTLFKAPPPPPSTAGSATTPSEREYDASSCSSCASSDAGSEDEDEEPLATNSYYSPPSLASSTLFRYPPSPTSYTTTVYTYHRRSSVSARSYPDSYARSEPSPSALPVPLPDLRRGSREWSPCSDESAQLHTPPSGAPATLRPSIAVADMLNPSSGADAYAAEEPHLAKRLVQGLAPVYEANGY